MWDQSVWQCVLRVFLAHVFSSACSAPTAPPGWAAPAHLLTVSRAASNLAASVGAAGALSVSSPQYCQKSSVISPHRLSQRVPSKSSRLGLDWSWQPHFPPVYAAAVILFPLSSLPAYPAGGYNVSGRVTSDDLKNLRIIHWYWMETKPSTPIYQQHVGEKKELRIDGDK